MTDHAAIRSLLDRVAAAIHDKDAAAVIACYDTEIVSYDLAPPLANGPEVEHDPAGITAWFATWDGPIVVTAAETTLHVGGDVAYAHGLRRMTGTKTGGEKVDLWFRATVGLARKAGRWRIAHVHHSVPFAMDGSDRALLDLKP